MAEVRDRLWLWGHDAGSHDRGWGLPSTSRITPVEAAFYMGIPNVMMIRYSSDSRPASAQHALPFQALSRVMWSIVGGSGFNSNEETARVLKLPEVLANMTGVVMDDFFREPANDQEAGALPLVELRRIRQELTARGLELWVVLYAHQLELPISEHLALCDGIILWTWLAEDLASLEANFQRLQQLAPDRRRMVGCYMWDYGTGRPMPVPLMKRQCETGLQWLREGQVEGMVFLASCICDLQLESVEWTRQWIAAVGRRPL